MNKKLVIGGFALAGVGLAVWIGLKLQAAQSVKITFKRIQKVRFTNGLIIIDIVLNALNTSGIGLNLNSLSVVNAIDKVQLGSTVLLNDTRLLAKATTEVPIVVQIPYNELITALPQLLNVFLNIFSTPLKLRVTGNAIVEGAEIPLDISTQFIIPKLN
jgi:hypothetical protein